MWISPEFKVYLIREFQRLKEEEQNLIPAEVSEKQISFIYANEADLLNVALFGMTAKEWRDANPDLKGNIRDYATINQLICLSNMESLNAIFINEGIRR